MTFIIQRNPDDTVNRNMSPWQGCQVEWEGGFWYATELARPTLYKTKVDADQALVRAQAQLPSADFKIADLDALQINLFDKAKKPIPKVVEKGNKPVVEYRGGQKMATVDWGDGKQVASDEPF